MQLLTPKQVCKMLSISKPFLIKLVQDGKIHPIRIGKLDKTGGTRRFYLSDIETLIKSWEKNV